MSWVVTVIDLGDPAVLLPLALILAALIWQFPIAPGSDLVSRVAGA
jgi:hypothetical protein